MPLTMFSRIRHPRPDIVEADPSIKPDPFPHSPNDPPPKEPGTDIVPMGAGGPSGTISDAMPTDTPVKQYPSSMPAFDGVYAIPEVVYNEPDPEESGVTDKVSFTRFRFPVWKGPIEKIDTALQQFDDVSQNYTFLKKGSYVITISGKVDNLQGWTAPLSFNEPFEFKIAGKRQRIEKMEVDPGKGIVRLQLTIIDNPIPLLVLLSGAFLSAGFAGYMFTDTLVQVDKILDDLTVLTILGLLAAGGWYFFRGKK